MKKIILILLTVFFSLNVSAQDKTFNLSTQKSSFVCQTKEVTLYFDKDDVLQILKRAKGDNLFFDNLFLYQQPEDKEELHKYLDDVIADLSAKPSFEYDTYFIYGFTGDHKVEGYIRCLIPYLLEHNKMAIQDKSTDKSITKITRKKVRQDNKDNYEYYSGKSLLIWVTYEEEKPFAPIPNK